MSMYYSQSSPEWELCNSNYNQMASVLTQVVKTMTTLRVEAPEWYPQRYKGGENLVNKDANWGGTRNCGVAKQEETQCGFGKEMCMPRKHSVDTDEWTQPKKVCHNVNRQRKNMVTSSENSFSMLEEDDDDDEEDDDNTSENESNLDVGIMEEEQNGQNIDIKNTREMLWNETSRLKKVIEMKDEMCENETFKLHQQMRYFQGESEACEEMNTKNEKELVNLCDNLRLNKVVHDCTACLMINEMKKLDQVVDMDHHHEQEI